MSRARRRTSASKSCVNRDRVRAHGTCSMRTPQWRQRTRRTAERTHVRVPQTSRCRHSLAGLTSWRRCLVSPHPEHTTDARVGARSMTRRSSSRRTSTTHHPLAENSCSVSSQDAEEHPSGSEVSLHTPPWTGRRAHSAHLSQRRGRVCPDLRHRGSAPRRAVRSRGATGAERSELALEGAAAGVASHLHGAQAAIAITRTREDPTADSALESILSRMSNSKTVS